MRDLLLQGKPKDFDILTTATPVQVTACPSLHPCIPSIDFLLRLLPSLQVTCRAVTEPVLADQAAVRQLPHHRQALPHCACVRGRGLP